MQKLNAGDRRKAGTEATARGSLQILSSYAAKVPLEGVGDDRVDVACRKQEFVMYEMRSRVQLACGVFFFLGFC